jgi:hypothetical protein
MVKRIVETACHAMVTFKDGQCLMIRNSWAEMNEREVVSVTFQGSRAEARWNACSVSMAWIETSCDTAMLYTEEYGNQVNREILVQKDETMGRVANAANFVQSITEGKKPMNTPEEALILMQITDAIYKSSETVNVYDFHKEGMYMSRLVTLASGQFGDLALEDLCRLAKEMGYDGLELATHAHFNVQKALHDPSYLPMVHETLNRYGLVCRAISAH